MRQAISFAERAQKLCRQGDKQPCCRCMRKYKLALSIQFRVARAGNEALGLKLLIDHLDMGVDNLSWGGDSVVSHTLSQEYM